MTAETAFWLTYFSTPIMTFALGYAIASRSWRKYVEKLLVDLQVYIWDHDPDTRYGPVFNNADELIAYLRKKDNKVDD